MVKRSYKQGKKSKINSGYGAESLLLYEIILLIGALAAPHWSFLLALSYMIVSRDRLKKAREMALRTEKESEEAKGLNISSKPALRRLGTPGFILPYKNCVVEVYGGLKDGSARIMKPSGDDLGKEFASVGDAIREIDFIEPFLTKKYTTKSLFMR